MSWSCISTTVTAEPSAPYTWAISRPMTPLPTTSSRAGTEGRASAAVESQMRGSSGQPGRVTGELPVARMASVKRTPGDPVRTVHLEGVRAGEHPPAGES